MLSFPLTIATMPLGEQLVVGMIAKIDWLLMSQNCTIQTVGGRMPALRFNEKADYLLGDLKSDVFNMMDAKQDGHDIPMELFAQHDYRLEFEKYPSDFAGGMLRMNLLVYTPCGRMTLEIL